MISRGAFDRARSMPATRATGDNRPHANIAETLPDFISAFWMRPLLGMLGLRSKDWIGYMSVQFFLHSIVMIVAALLDDNFHLSRASSAVTGGRIALGQ